TKYGDICLLWCDTPFQITPEQSKELRDLVKELQPECLLNSRIGNGLGDYVSMGDNVIPDEYMEDILVESPTTLNDTWGFKYFDDNWKNADEVIRIKEHLNARGVNYLLNVGPDHLGRIPVPALEILREVGKKQNQ
ncbi:MAG: alpha-L-fucosidase, partial [Clostridia bacterium]|nr:alpha-L-fucosidase [Clostridia bacterium]